MAIKRSVDFLDWLVQKGMATRTSNGIVMKQLSSEQLRQLKYDYKNGDTSERLDFQRTKYVRKK